MTDSTTLAARWSLRFENLQMAHMSGTGVSGLDLYASLDGAWRWAGAYREVVNAELPDADIVFDKFRLIAIYHAVIDEVRRSEWRKANAEDKAVIKGRRYNLLSRIVHRACGVQNLDYLFLKLRQESLDFLPPT